jgi:hypothetical protein
MKPHKWAKEIKAWADGAEIEQRWIPSMSSNSGWKKIGKNEVDWNLPTIEFRIKPQPKEPQYLYVWQHVESKIINLKDNDTAGSNWSKLGKIKLEVDND